MSNISERCAKILLKARPTAEQLADRLADPVPDGLELYLDASDISGERWLATLEARLAALDVPAGFVWVVEGPLRSLDGSFFDLSRPTAANMEVIRRLVAFGRAVGASAAVIHAIAPTTQAEAFSREICNQALQESLPLLRFYAKLCRENDIVPTIENVPPVTKMRESRLMHSLIGMAPADMIFLTENTEGLRVTFDLSHAQLYLNAAASCPSAVPEEIAPLVSYLSRSRTVSTIADYIDTIDRLVLEAHFSNARGLFGEGLAYNDGEIELDWVVMRLRQTAEYLVTETIEPDPRKAILMREAQRRMTAVLASVLNT